MDGVFNIGSVPDFAVSPMPGVRTWKNRVNKIFVFRLHYTADPDKRTQEWHDSARAGMTKRDWDREYEISFTTPAGDPVFIDEFSYEHHVATKPLRFDSKYPLLLGWDFGLSPGVSFSQFFPDTRWNILDEMWTPRMGIERFAPQVLMRISMFYPGAKIICFVDPSGSKESEVDERSSIQILEAHFDDVRMGAEAWEFRRRSMALMMSRSIKGTASVQIDPRCHLIITGLQGGYHYPERQAGKKLTRAMERPVKNEYSHLQDGLQMVATGMIKLVMTQVEEGALDGWDGWEEPKATNPWTV
jgi:hypothetical protein